MRLKKEQIEKISHLILRNLKDKNLITMRVSEKKVEEKINEVITKDMLLERKIDDEARDTLDKYRSQIKGDEFDERKMLMMIKKELVKKYKFVM
ncbi:DUF507 family protein [bacterium]|nr:DUF507 family protein [bacterium]